MTSGSPASRVFFGAASIGAGHGGLARLSRLTARTLASMTVDVAVLSLLDEVDSDLPVSYRASSRGRKLDFLVRCHAAALTRTHFLFDTVNVARAHPKSPFPRRPYGLWMAGVEIWEGLNPARRATLDGADLVIAISKFTLDHFEEMHGTRPPASVCWLGTEDDDASPVSMNFSGVPTALIVGRLDLEECNSKGQEELIRVWPAVVAVVPKARLLIVGGGSALSHVRALAAGSTVSANIEVVGFVPEREMAAVWGQAHVFAMPSRNEGFGLVYVEAMRHGLPVVASTHDAGQEVNVHGETGFNVCLDNDDELAGCLVQLLSDLELCKQMGERGRERWRTYFRFSAFRDRLAPILKGFLGT